MEYLIRLNTFKAILLILLLSIPQIINSANRDSLEAEIDLLEGKQKVDTLFELFKKNLYNNTEKAKLYAEEALKVSVEADLDSYITYSYIYIGLSYYFMNQWRLSNDYNSKALITKFANSNQKIKASIINNIALNYKFLGEYEKSIEYIFDALKIFETEKDSLLIAKTRGNLGVLYLKLKKSDEAIKYFNLAQPIFVRLKDSISIADNYENYSAAYFEKGNSKKGIEYFSLAEKMVFRIKDTTGIASLYFEHGQHLFSNLKYNEALYYFTKSLAFCDSNITPNQYFLSIEGQGKASLYSGKIDKAEKLLKVANNGFQRLKATESIWMSNLDLAKLYAKNGSWKEFNSYFDLYEENRNNFIKEKEINTVAELNLIYKTEKKNQQIELQNIEIENKNNKILLISIIALLVSIGFFIALYLTRKLNFANKNLVEKNLELSERWKQLQKFYGSAESESLTSSQNDLFRKIYHYMVDEQAFTNCSITVDYLSKQLSSNTKYISKAIKEETGMNFNTFINTFRIEEAKRILRDKISSTWSLDAVAEQSGFNNTTSFFQAFKKNTGLTPSAFRSALVTSLYK